MNLKSMLLIIKIMEIGSLINFTYILLIGQMEEGEI